MHTTLDLIIAISVVGILIGDIMPVSEKVQQALERAAKLAASVAEDDAGVRVDEAMDKDEAAEKEHTNMSKAEKKLAKAKEQSRLKDKVHIIIQHAQVLLPGLGIGRTINTCDDV